MNKKLNCLLFYIVIQQFFKTSFLLPDCIKMHSQSTDTGVSFMMTFNSSRCLLSEVVKIEGKDNVIIQGIPTEIICDNTLNAGLWFRQVTNLIIKDLTLLSCGVLYNSTTQYSTTYYFRSAANIESCTNITLQAVEISGSCGTGLVMLDNDGVVHINDSRFENNGQLDDAATSGGNGLYIEISYCGCRPQSKWYMNYCTNDTSKNVSNSKYYITNSSFEGNRNGHHKSYSQKERLVTRSGVGGGMALIVGGHSKGNKFHIQGSIFTNNTASLGGGLYIAVQDESTCNEVVINGSNFQMNSCTSSTGRGGGIDAEFLLLKSLRESKNFIQLINCIFLKNKAKYGGGGSFHSRNSVDASIINSVELISCSWINNSAIFGAALGISSSISGANSHAAMIVKMKNNRLISNYVSIQTNIFTSNGKAAMLVDKINGKAAMLVDKINIKFSGDILFEKNNGSALCLDSSEANFVANSHIQFKENSGFQGGAIAMTGYSVIKFSDNSTFLFANNSALDGGGALFQLAVSTQDIQISRICFIQYTGKKNNLEDYNTSFIFINNSGTPRGRGSSTQISRFGHTILTTTISPCYKSTKACRNRYRNETFYCIANFTFEDQNKYDLSTFENEIKLNQSLLSVIPGKLTALNFESIDEFSNVVDAVYHVFIRTIDSEPTVIMDSTHISRNRIKFYGKPGERATVVLESTSIRKLSSKIEIEMQECPPGYVFQLKDKKSECICLSDIVGSDLGICCCNRRSFQANLSYGYWIGYVSNETLAKEKDLILSFCPFGRCLESKRAYIVLPNNTNRSILDSLFCGDYRTGVFCSKCKSNYSTNYHSRTYSCSPSPNRCQLGWLYYTLSELVPATVFFVIVISFDLRLSSGSINGFLLFMQLSDSLQIQGNGFIKFPYPAKKALEVYFLIIGVFNMNFFEAEELSYCLWDTATTVDLLAFKYVTITYALGLVVTMILVLKYCNLKHFKVIQRCLSKKAMPVSVSNTIIHGLSGFLIICYSEATKISLLLLTPVKLYTFGNESKLVVSSTVAAIDGDLLFFQGKHLVYAIPALLVLGVLGLAPPVLLFIYPLCYKLFGLLRISESRFIKVLCIMIPLEKFKPFFDSFQSGFKDDCRFFAGLYFLYRLITLASFTLANQSRYFYGLVALQFLVMLALHAIFQPLKRQMYNVVDALLFTNIFLINSLSITNLVMRFHSEDRQKYIDIFTSIQVFLLYLPLICVSICVAKKILRRVNKKIRKRSKNGDLLNYRRFSAIMDAAENRYLEDTIF